MIDNIMIIHSHIYFELYFKISLFRYSNVVRLEQMKLYSLLIAHVGQQLLGAEPFLRPLLKLLNSFKAEITPADVEGY